MIVLTNNFVCVTGISDVVLANDMKIRENADCIDVLTEIFKIGFHIRNIEIAKTLIKERQTIFIEQHKKSLMQKRQYRALCQTESNAEDIEIVQKICKIETPDELSTHVILAEIKQKWPNYFTQIISTIKKLVSLMMELIKKESKNETDISASLFVFLWSVAKPTMQKMITFDCLSITETILRLDFYFGTKVQVLVVAYQQKNSTDLTNVISALTRDYNVAVKKMQTNVAVGSSNNSWFEKFNNIFYHIKNEWPEYLYPIFSTLMQIASKIFITFFSGQLKTYGDLFALIVEFLWPIVLPMIRKLSSKVSNAYEISGKLYNELVPLINKLVSQFQQYLKNKYRTPVMTNFAY